MIGVVIPVYNVEKYLPRCLDSLLAQTDPDFAVITVDDGSKDGSLAICRGYAERDSRFHALQKENGGCAAARNHALAQLDTEYVLFLDSDDWLEPNTIACLKEAVRAFPGKTDCVVFGNYVDYAEEGYSLQQGFPIAQPQCLPAREAITAMEQEGLLNLAWNKLYSVPLLQKLGLRFQKGTEPGEDLIFNCTYFRHVRSCVLLPDHLYHYMRQGEMTIVRRYDPNLAGKIPLFLAAREELYAALGMDDPASIGILRENYYYYWTSCLYNIYGSEMVSRKDRTAMLHRLFADENMPAGLAAVRARGRSADAYYRIYAALSRTHSPAFADAVYSTLFWSRNHLKPAYNTFQKRLLQRGKRNT